MSGLQDIVPTESYSLDQVFNANETELWWKLIPWETLVHAGETHAKNFMQPKDRVTLLGCCNTSGTCKLPLIWPLSTKVQSPAVSRMLKWTYYQYAICRRQKHGLMQAYSIIDVFVPHVKRFCLAQGIEYQVFLRIDNAPAHPSIEKLTSHDGRVKTMTNDEIIMEVRRENASDTDEEDDIEESSHSDSPSPTVAYESFENILKWLECQADTNTYHLLLVGIWRVEAAWKRAQNHEQTSLKSYFN